MYRTDAVNCQNYAQKSADNMSDVILMVVLSIQQPWWSVGDQMVDARANGESSRFIWGNKLSTYKYLKSNKHKIYSQMMAVVNSSKSDADKAFSLVKVFLKVRGLGVAKAGFVCQLCVGLVGCMDSHNIKLYGVDPKDLRLNPSPKTSKALELNNIKIKNYIDLCHGVGTETLWDKWCNHLATLSNKWIDGNHVSAVHFNYLTGE